MGRGGNWLQLDWTVLIGALGRYDLFVLPWVVTEYPRDIPGNRIMVTTYRGQNKEGAHFVAYATKSI